MESMRVPEDKFMTIKGLCLHYLDWGGPENIPMILLHGLCSNAHYWDFFARSMRKEYHVLALDQRGYGDSGWAEGYGPKDYVLDWKLSLLIWLWITSFLSGTQWGVSIRSFMQPFILSKYAPW